MNTVVQQEVKRYNRLINLVKTNLKSIIDAIDGTNVMNNDIDLLINKFFDN